MQFFRRTDEVPMQPPRPSPKARANAGFLLVGALALAGLVMGAFFMGIFSYGGVPVVDYGGGSASAEPEPRQPIHSLPETIPPSDPPPQRVDSESPSAPEPSGAPPPPAEPLPPAEPPPPSAPQASRVPEGSMFGKKRERESVSLTSSDQSLPSQAERAAAMRHGNGQQAGAGGGLGPRNNREEYAVMAGRGRKIYHDAAVVQPPQGMCVLRGSDIWPLTTPQEIQTALPGGFTMKVIADVKGRIYDGVDSVPCDYPVIPAQTELECEGNVSDVRRGDKAVQGVCSLAIFPGGNTLPLEGFMLTGPDGMVGLPANSRYNWGDEIKGTAIDLIAAIPGAVLNFATLGAVGGLADVAVNIGTNNFQRSAQMYREQEHKVVPILYVPRAAPAGLRPGVMIALPDEPR